MKKLALILCSLLFIVSCQEDGKNAALCYEPYLDKLLAEYGQKRDSNWVVELQYKDTTNASAAWNFPCNPWVKVAYRASAKDQREPDGVRVTFSGDENGRWTVEEIRNRRARWIKTFRDSVLVYSKDSGDGNAVGYFRYKKGQAPEMNYLAHYKNGKQVGLEVNYSKPRMPQDCTMYDDNGKILWKRCYSDSEVGKAVPCAALDECEDCD